MLLQQLEPDELRLLEDLAAGSDDPCVKYEKESGRAYEGAPCMYVEEARSTRRRFEILSALARHGLAIFGGSDWTRAPSPLVSCYAGHPVSYGFDLASVYYHSKINLNVFHVQCVNSTNSRVYDVLASGGFLLSEHRPCLEDEFEVGRHLVTFTTAEEAREKGGVLPRESE